MNLEKVEKATRVLFVILFLISFFIGIFYKNTYSVLVSFISIILIISSRRFNNKKGIEIESSISIIFLVFVFMSNFLGEFLNFYGKFWFWDLILHSSAGFLLGLFGVSLVYLINKDSKDMKLNPFFVAFFGFCFAMTLSVFWEFFEFFMDSVFKTNMLKSGLDDTMGDLIVAAIGAGIVSLFGYLGLKHYYKRAVKFLKKLVTKS